MNNILILGSGRSGTSMLTGMLARSSFHFGDNFEYLSKNKANPKGYFEDYEVNTVNEDILKENLIHIPETIRKLLFPSATFYRARWLARLPVNKKIVSIPSINKRIEMLIKKPTFCYKDPRLSYTLPVWKSIIEENTINVKYLVVFREPEKTANSIVRECKESKALHPLKMNMNTALKVWELMYSHIIKNYKADSKKEDWMFVHYNQLFSNVIYEKIEDFIGSPIDKEFPEIHLSRAKAEETKMNKNLLAIYNQLNELTLNK